jgi:hypothetical protein
MPHAVVVPVPGDGFAPPGTSVTFLDVGVSALTGLSVVGSTTGPHLGTLTPIAGGEGVVFTPAKSFAGGEMVTVLTPDLVVVGAGAGPYTFETALPPAPAAASAAIKAALATDAAPTAPRRRGTAAPPAYAPPACPDLIYKSAPNLNASRVCMNTGVKTSAGGQGTYLFLTPGATGAGIYASDGRLEWWLPSGANQASDDESVVQYNGSPYLAVWKGPVTNNSLGAVTLYDEHYQVAGVIQAGSGFGPNKVDLHEFKITPWGTALVGIYDPVSLDVGGSYETVVQYVVQELSLVQTPAGISTGAVLFEWDSLNDVAVSQSQTPPTAGRNWDYFHGNAVSVDPDGGLLVSARDTWGIYNLDDTHDATFEHVVWEVGAKGDSAPPRPWCYQHDIAGLGGGKFSLFDDGGAGPGCLPGSTEHQARALVFSVNPTTHPASVSALAAYVHNPPIYAGFTGSTQVLPNGDVLVDWGNIPEITEYSRTGSVRIDLSMAAFSYRGFRYPWVGEPLTAPAIAAAINGANTDVWATWNGATQVASWQVLGGTSTASLAPVGKPQSAPLFETHIVVPGDFSVVEVEALSTSGAVLGTSPPLTTSSAARDS